MNGQFEEFPKIYRMSREVIVTEKIDGTNGQILIGLDESIQVGSRSRWITPAADNHGFARWVEEHKEELLNLGPGRHFGEWWGSGIQRGYGLKEKRFSLFNVSRWHLAGETPRTIPTQDPRVTKQTQELPPCCGLVPVLWQGIFDTSKVDRILEELKDDGSHASPGFMRPEGVVVYHIAGNFGLKKTLDNDAIPKSLTKGTT